MGEGIASISTSPHMSGRASSTVVSFSGLAHPSPIDQGQTTVLPRTECCIQQGTGLAHWLSCPQGQLSELLKIVKCEGTGWASEPNPCHLMADKRQDQLYCAVKERYRACFLEYCSGEGQDYLSRAHDSVGSFPDCGRWEGSGTVICSDPH